MNQLASTFGFHVHYVNVAANRPDIGPIPRATPGYVTRPVDLDDLLPYAGRVFELSRDFLEEAFADGGGCVANFYGDELVGYCFTKLGRTRVTDQIDALIPHRFVYTYKDWTHPEHLRAGLRSMRTYVRESEVLALTGERSISYMETHNYPTLLRSNRHPSARRIRMGYVGWITVFGREIPFNTRQAKKLGFEFVGKDDPGRRQYVW